MRGTAAPGALAAAIALLPLVGVALAWVSPPPSLFGDPARPEAAELLRASLPTLELCAIVCPGALALGTWIAWVGDRACSRGLRALVVAAALSFATPSYLLAATAREALGPAGWLGRWLGVEGAFTGLGPAALVLTVACAPLAQLVVAAALRRVPAGEEEAARSLGASPWRIFATIYLPRLRPAWALSFGLVALYTIADFGAVAVLDCEVLTFRLYQEVQLGRLQHALELGALLVCLALPGLLLVRLLSGRAASERPVGGATGCARRPLRPLGAALALAPLALVTGLGLGLPTLTLAGWVARGVRAGTELAPLGPVLADSLLLAGAGTVAVIALALGPALAVARRRGGGVVQRALFAGGGLPGVLVGFGLIELRLILDRQWPAAGGAPALGEWLERAGLLLVLGYAARYLFTAFAALEPVAERLDPRLDEAARVLGAGRASRFARVALPALAPGVAAAAVLVFVSLLKELPVTLLLAPIGRRTLAYRAFDAYQQVALPEAGVAGLLLCGFALGAQALALRGRWR